MANFFSSIFQWFAAIPWDGFYNTVRVIVIILDVILFAGFIFALKKALEYRPKLVSSFRRTEADGDSEEESPFDTASYAKNWDEIMKKAFTKPPESLTLAIVAADNLVGDALEELGLEGEHIADRLQKLNPKELKTLNNLWRAHRLRNDLVHTTGFEIKESEAKEVLEIFESFLKEIGALK